MLCWHSPAPRCCPVMARMEQLTRGLPLPLAIFETLRLRSTVRAPSGGFVEQVSNEREQQIRNGQRPATNTARRGAAGITRAVDRRLQWLLVSSQRTAAIVSRKCAFSSCESYYRASALPTIISKLMSQHRYALRYHPPRPPRPPSV